VDSVFAQTAADFEVIIVDDHSAGDEVAALVREHNDGRLRSLKVTGRGGAATARNIGIRGATADYIAFLDDDDEWLPGKLAAQLGVMERCDRTTGGVYTARLTIDSLNGRTKTERFQARFQPGVTDTVITTSSVLLRRECFERVGFFDEDLAVGSDYDMWIRIGREYAFHYLDEVLVKYYVHMENLSHDYQRQRDSFVHLLNKHAELFAHHPRFLARQYTILGAMCLRDRIFAEALSAFWRGVRSAPLEWRTYARAFRGFARTFVHAAHRSG